LYLWCKDTKIHEKRKVFRKLYVFFEKKDVLLHLNKFVSEFNNFSKIQD
jgi:hypothetical protein